MTGLFRILFLFIGFVLLRRVVRGLFLGNRARRDENVAPSRREAAPNDDPRQDGPPQEIEEADYEELD